MIQIRNSIFETNSSSTHALCISMNDFYRLEIPEYYKQWRKQAKPLNIIGGYYGRSPQKPLIELEEKANYLWTAVLNFYSNYNCYRVEENHYKIFYTCSDEDKLAWWKEQILKELPENSTLKDYYDDYDIIDYPWIDHNDKLKNFIKACEDQPQFIHCLLDDESFIEISGDEYPNFITAFLPYNEEQIINMPGQYSVYIKGN